MTSPITIKDDYPPTNIQENLQKLKGAKIFTFIDGAYHCIQIEEGSRDCTAFYQSFQNILFHMHAFWLANARSVYSQMLDLALAHLPADYWLSYLDNILVYSMDTWAHLEHLRKVVQLPCSPPSQDSGTGVKPSQLYERSF